MAENIRNLKTKDDVPGKKGVLPKNGINPVADYYTWDNTNGQNWEKQAKDRTIGAGMTALNYNGAITKDLMAALKGIEGASIIAPSKTSTQLQIVVPTASVAKLKTTLKI